MNEGAFMHFLKQIQPLFFFNTTFMVSFFLGGCGSQPVNETSTRSEKPSVQVTLSKKGYDLNQDQKEDMWRITAKKGELEYLDHKAFDFNFDGKVDFRRYFDPQGQRIRDESDLDFDGLNDLVVHYEGNQMSKKEIHLQGPRKVDVFEYYEEGKLRCSEIDDNADGLLDRWERFDPESKKKKEGLWSIESACAPRGSMEGSQNDPSPLISSPTTSTL